MQRRALIRTLGGLAAAPFVPRAATVAAAPRVQHPILLQVSPLAGFQYHEGGSLWPQLAVGQTLQLTREPDNPYDPRAVRIDWRGHELGYLPRLENTAIAQMLDRGEHLDVRIANLGAGPSPWDRIELEVRLAA